MELEFNEEEQIRIFKRALELQREENFPGSLNQLALNQMELTALEAGIELRFLSAAISEVEAGPSSDRAAQIRQCGLLCTAIVQIYLVSGCYQASERNIYVPLIFLVLVGALSTGKKAWTYLFSCLAIAALFTLLTIGYLSQTDSKISDLLWVSLGYGSLAQVLALIFGQAAAQLQSYCQTKYKGSLTRLLANRRRVKS